MRTNTTHYIENRHIFDEKAYPMHNRPWMDPMPLERPLGRNHGICISLLN